MNIMVLVGARDFNGMAATASWRPFDERTLDFLVAFSECLFRNPQAGAWIDTLGLVSFCRRSHLESLRAQHGSRLVSSVGRGLSFHIAPSNVPVNFAYSLILGLLSGNGCIVRASTMDFAETRIVCEVLQDLLSAGQFAVFRNRISIVRYERDRAINDFFSLLCDVRLIWGGDQTVSEIRKSPLSARAIDVVFPDRYSACVVDAAGYLEMLDKRAVAIGFYNDTYRNHQAACTAPRLVYWLGSAELVQSAQSIFWRELDAVLAAKAVEMTAIETVEKFMASCRVVLRSPGAKVVADTGPRIRRVCLSVLDESITAATCGGGFFVEYQSDEIEALARVVNTKFQTLTYVGQGAAALAREVAFSGAKGVDRVVPNGRASEFSLFWDGYDLMSSLTRHVAVA